MNYCYKCGTKLTMKYHDGEEKSVAFCEACQDFRYSFFNSAISAVVLTPNKDRALLIQQYGRKGNILLAGYINKGESAEEALIREVKEEICLNVTEFQYKTSFYYEKSNTLMLSFHCVVDSDDLSHISDEVDTAQWYSFDDARKAVRKDSLAENFLIANLNWLEKNSTNK